MGIRLRQVRPEPANLPNNYDQTQRWDAGPGGRPVPVPTDGAPALADGFLQTGDKLEASKTAKPGGYQTLMPEPPVNAQALLYLSRPGLIIPSASLQDAKVRVKLGAKGYVNAADVALRRGVRGLPIMTEDVELKA